MQTVFSFELVVALFNIFLIKVVLDVFDFPISLSLCTRVSVIMLIKDQISMLFFFKLIGFLVLMRYQNTRRSSECLLLLLVSSKHQIDV